MSAGHDERWNDAVGSYLLHAMPPEEAAAFEAHLDTCTDCRRELDELRVAADALPASPMPVQPPPELKERIMAVVEAEADLLRAAGARADAPAPTAPPRRSLRERWALRPRVALAGALAVLAVGVVAGLLGGSVLRGEGTRTVTAQFAPAGAQVRLVVRDSGHSTLVARRMPSPGRGRIYQVWLVRGKAAPEPNSLFDVRNGAASVDVPGDLSRVDRVLVTSEPGGGSPTPTRPPVVGVVPS